MLCTGSFPGGICFKKKKKKRKEKNPSANAGDIRDGNLIPGSGRSSGGGHDSLLQYSCLESPHGQRSLVDYSP